MKVLSRIFLATLLLSICTLGQQLSAQVSTTTSTTDFPFTRNLSMGVRGNDVFVLQQFLIAGEFLNLKTPTGYYGPATKSAVMRWQKSVGITPSSGFFGPLSREKISTPVKITPIVLNTQKPISLIATTSMSLTNNGSPVRLKIPKLDIDAVFQYNGLTALGVMEIPSNVSDVGWYTGSPRLGEKGASIITGHVAQIRGGVITKQGVFARLRELASGDTLSIIDDRGVSKTFIIRESRTYDPAADTTDIFFPNDNGSHLRLITCEGMWEADKQSFTKRLVVFADLLN